MKIVRFSIDDEPSYGIVDTHGGQEVVVRVAGDPLFGAMKATGQVLPLEEVRLLAPVLPRSKVVGVGRNYREHAAELGHEVPAEPLLFLKPNTSVVGPYDPVVMPNYSDDVQFEGELAVVIGRLCKDVPEDDTARVIAGFMCANDVTARDIQRSDATWARAKGFDSACPVGPYLVDDFDPATMTLTTSVDGEERQRATGADMVHSVAQLVSYVSHHFSLLPGDIILTGTPAGVGPVSPGSEVSVSIEGLGTLTNRFVRDEDSPQYSRKDA